MGLAVLAEVDGWRIGRCETTYYLMVTGEYGYSYITVPDPLDENSFVLLDVKTKEPYKKVIW